MKIWRCPQCRTGVRAPERMRKLDTRRYCLVCSARAPLLVERVCESAERAKQRRTEQRATKSEIRAERTVAERNAAIADAQRLAASFDRPRERAAEWLRAWAPRIVALRTLREHFREHYPGQRWRPQIQIRQGRGTREEIPRDHVHEWMQRHRGGWSYLPSADSPIAIVSTGRQHASGHAWPWEHRLCVTTGASAAGDLSVLIHELAHLAAPRREHHGPVFQLVQRDAVQELTGEIITDWHRHGAQCRDEVIARWLQQQQTRSK